MRPRWTKLIWIAPLAILGILLFIAIGGEIVMLLWNWLVPALFGWRQITFWQAVGLLALCRILFGGHGVFRTARSNMRHRIRERMQERWARMTPEERERMRERFRRRCGPFEPPNAEPTA
jgi:uncharacterized membrane protein